MYKWYNSNLGSKWKEEKNIYNIMKDYNVVIRFPVKFYCPKKENKSYSSKIYKRNIGKFFEIRAHLLRDSENFIIALTNML
jgi:hypothetical protein